MKRISVVLRTKHDRTPRRARHLLIVGLLALPSVGAVAAYAATAAQPDQGGVFRGCYQSSSGNVRLLTGARPQCGISEVAIEWSQTGPAGPPGPAPLTVGVDAFGNRQAGTADVSVSHPAAGKYVVTFNDPSKLSARGTIACATLATLSRGMTGAFNSQLFDAPPGEISTFPGFGAHFPLADQVVVNTYSGAGTPADQPFWLALFC
jgi:hypothetical protein